MFQAWDFLSAATYEKLAERKAFSPTEIETEATKRLPPQQLPTKLVLAAADHNARMITAYRNNPICLGQRREYLARLVRMLLSPLVNGVEASPDIIEDLLLLNGSYRDFCGRDFLSGKLLIGTVNRGGLKGTAWEMDDFCSGFTVARIQQLHLDGVKFMLRLNPDSALGVKNLRYCAETVNLAQAAGLPIFIESLFVTGTPEQGLSLQTDLVSLIKVTGVASALGCSSARKWLELPLTKEYATIAGASTCPVLVVPEERETEPLDIIAEYTAQIGIAPNVRGILLGRNVMFALTDPGVLAHAIGSRWLQQASLEEAYRLGREFAFSDKVFLSEKE